jgi:hypothetical protein
MRINLAFWIRISIEIKSWIRICMTTDTDPQYWYMNTFIRTFKPSVGTGRVSDPDPYWIRIQSGQWIRIRIRIRNSDPDPEGQK